MSDAHLSEVVTLYDHNKRDIPARLRSLADQIEAGDFGSVGEAVCVIVGDTMEVFGWGELQDGSTSAVLLHAGALRLARAVERHGRE